MAFDFSPEAPQPPNPLQTAAASTSTNVATGVANSILNNVNQYTPTGNLEYQISHSYPWTDPVTNQTYNVPVWKALQSKPAEGTPERAISDANLSAQFNLADTAKNQSYFLRDYLNPNNPDGTPKQSLLSGAPAAGDPNSLNVGDPQFAFGGVNRQQNTFAPSGQQQYTFGDAGGPQFGFGDAGNVTRSYGPGDFSQDRSKVEEALFGRLSPQLEQDRARLEQRLADQGIRYGSEAYNDAMADLNRQQTDARLAVTAAGGQEQQRMMEMAAQRAGFENAAQQQAYTQALGRGTFANTAQNQLFEQMKARGAFANEAQARQFQENLQSGQFYNQAETQQFQQEAMRANFYNSALAQQLAQRNTRLTAQDQARSNYLSEQYAARNQPINEITSLMSGSQLSQPNFVTTPKSNIASTDVAGLINTRFNQDMQNYTNASNQTNQLIGGILGGLGGILSDERAKHVGDKMGTVFASGPNGEKPLPIYEYSYKGDPSGTRHIGPMAQDVEKIDRRAVGTHRGLKYINMTRLGSILKAA